MVITEAAPKRVTIETAEQALPIYRPDVNVQPKRPAELTWRTLSHIFRQKFIRRPQALSAGDHAGASGGVQSGLRGMRSHTRVQAGHPRDSHPGEVPQGRRRLRRSDSVHSRWREPTIYKQLPELINELVRRKIFVYCCTNALLLERMMKRVPPSKYLSWVIHLDGMETQHDISVGRKGVWKTAMAASKKALEAGYRVCSNTTLFRGSNPDDLHELFTLVTDMGFEGVMVTAGYDYVDGPVQEMFLSREESISVFKDVLTDEALERIRFYNNPLYLSFLRGDRQYQCTAWSNPTYTVQGWREPCYPLADRHTDNVDDLFSPALWENYGVGVNSKCSNCMMHCGFESATIYDAFKSPKGAVSLAKAVVSNRGGLGAS